MLIIKYWEIGKILYEKTRIRQALVKGIFIDTMTIWTNSSTVLSAQIA